MSENNDRLRKIVAPLTAEEASQKIYAKVVYYPQSIRVYIPNIPYNRNLPDLEPRDKLEKKQTHLGAQPVESRQENLERSIRRTKRTVLDYALCNKFDLFVTFTFKADRADINKCRSKMKNWLKNEQTRKGKFAYVIVPEFHKDGISLHFHAMLMNYPGKLLEAINPNTNEPLIKYWGQVYDIPSYTLGHTEAYKIADTWEDQARVGHYLCKYITKDMPVFQAKNRYWVSSGLAVPKFEFHPAEWYLDEEPARVYENDWGHTRIYLLRPLSSTRPDNINKDKLESDN